MEDEFLIGREAPDEGKLGQDAEISRQHARITHTGDEYVIEDLGSTNGTFLNGRKISRPEVLSAGDRIQVGATTLVVQVSVPSRRVRGGRRAARGGCGAPTRTPASLGAHAHAGACAAALAASRVRSGDRRGQARSGRRLGAAEAGLRRRSLAACPRVTVEGRLTE